MSSDWGEVAAELYALLAETASDLPQQDRDNVASFIEAGEFGVAFETLCTQMYEYDASPSPDALAQLAALGRRLKLEPGVWEIFGG
jgi:hypothetical protein